jgi:hypothetical protein
MALEMKAVCEKCSRPLVAQGEAYICSYECTFCPSCANRCTPSVRIAAANSCAVRVGKTKNYRTTVLAAPDLRPASGSVGFLCQLGHIREKRLRLADEKTHGS